ncbi:MAG: hypothetical protein ACAH12_09630 [Methylophilaceae bacterium]
MEKYKDLNGDSGVSGYEITPTWIRVQFKDGSIYEYDNNKPGLVHVNKMKALALAGDGLNSYIGLVVKKNYARKII